jgi:hypothetical protein
LNSDGFFVKNLRITPLLGAQFVSCRKKGSGTASGRADLSIALHHVSAEDAGRP